MKLPLFLSKKTKNINFFEMPAKKKKKIIKEAVRGSNELQRELAREFESQVSSTN